MNKHIYKFENKSAYANAKHNGEVNKPYTVYVEKENVVYANDNITKRFKTLYETEVGDICIFQSTGDIVFISSESLDLINDGYGTTYTPIGIVAIPYYMSSDKSVHIVALNYASSADSDRVNGTTDLDDAKMPWGSYSHRFNSAVSNIASPLLLEQKYTIITGNIDSLVLEEGYAQMDRYFRSNISHPERLDAMASIFDRISSPVISPYIGVDEKNPAFGVTRRINLEDQTANQTAHGSSIIVNSVSSYFLQDSEKSGDVIADEMNDYMLSQCGYDIEWLKSLAEETTFAENQYQATYDGNTTVNIYPAQLACYAYNNFDGWHLPTLNEFLFVMARIEKINNSINILMQNDQEQGGQGNYCTLSNGTYWTSTQARSYMTGATRSNLSDVDINTVLDLPEFSQDRFKSKMWGAWACDLSTGYVKKHVGMSGSPVLVNEGEETPESVLETEGGTGHTSNLVRPFMTISPQTTTINVLNDEPMELVHMTVNNSGSGGFDPIGGGTIKPIGGGGTRP